MPDPLLYWMSDSPLLGLRAAVALALALALSAPAVAPAHPVDTPAGHRAEDHVVHDAATEWRLNRETRLRSAAESRANAAAVAADPGQVGRWGPVVDWPLVGIHVALLPNGKVLVWDSVGDAATETFPVHDFTRATVYDPYTGTHTPVDVDTGYNVFCAGFAHLVDGSLFLAGGNRDAQLNGIVQTHLFNPANNDWSLGPNMAAGRWYPSVTPLANGEMLITEGGPNVPEVRKTDGSLRALSTASLDLPLYPWLDVAPDGRVFYSGPDQTMRKLDPAGGGSWQSFGQRDAINRSYGSRAVYDLGKTIVAGGGGSSSDARVIDTNGATPQVSATSRMAFGRRQHNLTLLADGSVLATGGNSTGAALVDMEGGVYNAERWDPATGQWTTLAPQAVTRQYHSTALLLPDGRVLSSGGGICGTCDQVGYLAKNAEVFTPPYLFKKDGSGELAPRPEITSAPATVTHGTSFEVATANAASIQKVGLLRLGSQTHSVEMEQRYVPLGFTAGNGTLTANVPANVHTAIPGVYMLFVVDSAGVPSVARMVNLDSAAPPRPPPPPNQPPTVSLTSPPNGAVFTSPAKISLTANAADSDGSVARVEFFSGATKLGEDTTPPYTSRWEVGAVGSYMITARATDNAGATATSTPVIITVRNPGPGGPGGGADVTGSPSVSGFGIGDSTLVSGAGTRFSFNSSEAGRAVLSFHKRVKGLKVRQRGRRRCVPQTRARLSRLRRSASSRAAYRRLLRQRRCRAWKRVGVIRREVVAGRNEIVWNGRVAGPRLSPGLYQVRLVITDAAGNPSRTERLRFRVLRRR